MITKKAQLHCLTFPILSPTNKKHLFLFPVIQQKNKGKNCEITLHSSKLDLASLTRTTGRIIVQACSQVTIKPAKKAERQGKTKALAYGTISSHKTIRFVDDRAKFQQYNISKRGASKAFITFQTRLIIDATPSS
jgi:hypothetical protein